MSVMGFRTVLAAALLLCAVGAAYAQRNYDVKTMNFDLWCQETQHWPTDRCDKRLPEDVKVFEDFRTKIESYEIPYLQKQNRDARLETDIIHNDPVDRPPVDTAQPPPGSLQAPPLTPQ
jgi:hypothetical protein